MSGIVIGSLAHGLGLIDAAVPGQGLRCRHGAETGSIRSLIESSVVCRSQNCASGGSRSVQVDDGSRRAGSPDSVAIHRVGWWCCADGDAAVSSITPQTLSGRGHAWVYDSFCTRRWWTLAATQGGRTVVGWTDEGEMERCSKSRVTRSAG